MPKNQPYGILTGPVQDMKKARKGVQTVEVSLDKFFSHPAVKKMVPGMARDFKRRGRLPPAPSATEASEA